MSEKNPGDISRRSGGNARPVAEFASKVLAPVISRRAAMTVDLVSAWPDIVGEQYADFTMPEKIDWPRRMSDDDPFSPGTLIVRCDGARAVLIQHESQQLIERVNLFFGFHAIGRIRLVQKPVTRMRHERAPPLPEPGPEARRKLDAILDRIDDPQLRARLEKIGRGVMARMNKPRS